MPFIVPPGGFAGFNQMTAASRAALGRVGGTPYKKTRRKSGGMRAAVGPGPRVRRRKRGTRARSSGRKIKFGSPAWQRKYKVGKFRK